VRSCIAFDAFCGSSQSFGSSASAFSSARRFSDFSTSKRPPQQFDRLLDFFDELLGFGAHESESPGVCLTKTLERCNKRIVMPAKAGIQ
jgi:hypothetical protein